MIGLLSVLLLLSSCSTMMAMATTTTASTTNNNEDYEMDLYAMTDEELEKICTTRGFELVKEDAFSHEDYVEAARQCLAIERDMEEIIAENPEILEELEKERDRMTSEKERLEKELTEAEKRIEQPHTAFVPGVKTEGEVTEEVLDLDVTTDADDSSFDPIGHQEPLSDSRVHEAPLNETTTTTTSEEVVSDKDTTTEDVPAVDATEKDTVPTMEEDKSFLALQRAILLELRDKIMRDLNMVADIVFPKPIRGPARAFLRSAGRVGKKVGMDIFRFMKRYAKAIVKNLKDRKAEKSAAAAEEEPARDATMA